MHSYQGYCTEQNSLEGDNLIKAARCEEKNNSEKHNVERSNRSKTLDVTFVLKSKVFISDET